MPKTQPMMIVPQMQVTASASIAPVMEMAQPVMAEAEGAFDYDYAEPPEIEVEEAAFGSAELDSLDGFGGGPPPMIAAKLAEKIQDKTPKPPKKKSYKLNDLIRTF